MKLPIFLNLLLAAVIATVIALVNGCNYRDQPEEYEGTLSLYNTVTLADSHGVVRALTAGKIRARVEPKKITLTDSAGNAFVLKTTDEEASFYELPRSEKGLILFGNRTTKQLSEKHRTKSRRCSLGTRWESRMDCTSSGDGSCTSTSDPVEVYGSQAIDVKTSTFTYVLQGHIQQGWMPHSIYGEFSLESKPKTVTFDGEEISRCR